MGSSSLLSTLPKNQRGQSPANAAPAHIAGAIGMNAHQNPPSHPARAAHPNDRASHPANARRNSRGFPSGLSGNSRNSCGLRSGSGGALTTEYLRLEAPNCKTGRHRRPADG